MKYTTEIDTVGIQIDCASSTEQEEVRSDIVNYINRLKSVFVSFPNNTMGNGDQAVFKNKSFVYYNHRVIATIDTGSSRVGYVENYETIYYINIKFAGLRSYHEALDKASNDSLLTICSYLNTRGIVFKLTELDVCLDVECAFDHMLSICTKKSAKTQYYALDNRQVYDTTTYIEKISKNKLNKAVLRAYTYDKSYKEHLDIDITRFEIKLQPKYFSRNDFTVESIQKVLNRYYVMYFESVEEKNAKIDAYNGYQHVRKREIKRLGLDNNRLSFNTDVIESFIRHIYTVHYNNLGVIWQPDWVVG